MHISERGICMKERRYLIVREPFCLTFEQMLKFHWRPTLYRFGLTGWHLYFGKFRLTRSTL